MTTGHPLDLSGTRALVTGGSRGIGSVVARTLAGSGADVLINYRADDASAEGTVEAIRAAGGTAAQAKANLQRPDEIHDLFDRIASGGGLDIIVHAAALGSFKPLADVRSNQWDLALDVGARSLLLCVKDALPLMSGRRGRIVALSSLGGTRVVPSYGAIGVSKAAMEATVRYLAVELAPRGIRVNGVAAGLVEGSSVERHADYAALASACRARTPAGRLGSAEDIASVVLFLCSPLSDWIVGQILVVDGGMSLPL